MISLRNEPARTRRRQMMKEGLSLTSVADSEDDVVNLVQKLSLSNHFGWTALQKTQVGDGTFPHLTRYYEKPDISGKETVMYVLYMDKGTVVQRDTVPKETQTVVSGILVREDELLVRKDELLVREDELTVRKSSEEKVAVKKVTVSEISEDKRSTKDEPLRVILSPEKPLEKKKPKKKKIISEFYYVPKNRSRSAKPVKSAETVGDSNIDYVMIKQTAESSKSQMSEIEQVLDIEEDKKALAKELEQKKQKARDKFKKEIEKEKERAEDIIDYMRKEGDKKKRKGADRWNLRAGAENSKREIENKKKAVEEVSAPIKTESKFINKLKYDKVKHEVIAPSEHLLPTASGTNRYLYVSKDRRPRNQPVDPKKH